MKAEKQFLGKIMKFAEQEEGVRAVGICGSRANSNVPADEFRDFDITFIVQDEKKYVTSQDWLKVFGKITMMQKPAAMSFFPSEQKWFSYLLLFADKVKMDVTIIPMSDLAEYLQSEPLLEILLDKDKKIKVLPKPSDEAFWLQQPTAEFFDDCCNEFWLGSTYVAKGLCREELLYANHLLETCVRPQLLTMLGWKIGTEQGFDFSLGKHYKFMQKHLDQKTWECLKKTYRVDTTDASWQALAYAHQLFRETSKQVAKKLSFKYPNYDKAVTDYIKNLGLK